MMKHKTLSFLTTSGSLCLISSLISAMAWADKVITVDNTRPDETFRPASTLPPKHMSSQTRTSGSDNTPSNQLSLTAEQLSQRPDLVIRALIPALKNNDQRGVELLLPIYEKLAEQDPLLLKWAKAMVAKKQGNLSQSIRLYREIIAQEPKLQPARLQLAIALTQNREYEAATGQFNQLRAENLPPQLTQIIDGYLSAIQEQDSWNIYGGGNYLREKNVNNAPKKGTKADGFTPSSQPEAAEGISYYVGATKTWSLAKGFFAEFNGDINGKYYWDNHKYDEFSSRIGLGAGYRNVQTEAKLIPYMEQFWYVGGENAKENDRTLHRYSKTSGVSFMLDHWLKQNWKVSTILEYGEQRYLNPERKKSNGNLYSLSNTLMYFPNSQQYWFIGGDWYRKNAHWKANAFDRRGVRLGWGQEWPKGISTRLQVNYAKRSYRMPSARQDAIFAPNFFKFAQKNHEYGINLTIWHRSIHWLGITPKITWSYQKTDSNNPFARYDRNRIYLSVSKNF
ncbi:surface lipoprotein assembly modifier [Pasteurella sp. PK-2025]|uniref:surface lipoprotein assembly modifier n=1 Tax=Pasteurella sp. PK-2025 TaxID=3413133 RepID=UPI003C75D95C